MHKAYIVVSAALSLSAILMGAGVQRASGSAVFTQETSEQPTTATDKAAANDKSQNGKAPTLPTTASPRKKRSLVPIESAAPPPPKKKVVRQGSAAEPSEQIVTDMDPAEATRRREESERLLSAADENLGRLSGRTLTEQQQETVSQIDHFIKVARSALKEGDISRGHTLALKANLLADDLVGH